MINPEVASLVGRSVVAAECCFEDLVEHPDELLVVLSGFASFYQFENEPLSAPERSSPSWTARAAAARETTKAGDEIVLVFVTERTVADESSMGTSLPSRRRLVHAVAVDDASARR